MHRGPAPVLGHLRTRTRRSWPDRGSGGLSGEPLKAGRRRCRGTMSDTNVLWHLSAISQPHWPGGASLSSKDLVSCLSPWRGVDRSRLPRTAEGLPARGCRGTDSLRARLWTRACWRHARSCGWTADGDAPGLGWHRVSNGHSLDLDTGIVSCGIDILSHQRA